MKYYSICIAERINYSEGNGILHCNYDRPRTHVYTVGFSTNGLHLWWTVWKQPLQKWVWNRVKSGITFCNVASPVSAVEIKMSHFFKAKRGQNTLKKLLFFWFFVPQFSKLSTEGEESCLLYFSSLRSNSHGLYK